MVIRGSGQKVLAIKPTWDAISPAWEVCETFFSGRGLTPDEVHALCMAAQELLENAVKYGRFDGTQSINVVLTQKGADFSVEVTNPATADEVKLKRLDATIQWIRGFQNPFDAYVEKMKQLASMPYQPGVSGLGLVRVAYEAQCLLDFYVSDTNQMLLSAFYRAREAPAG